jgi:hypothetical protein
VLRGALAVAATWVLPHAENVRCTDRLRTLRAPHRPPARLECLEPGRRVAGSHFVTVPASGMPCRAQTQPYPAHAVGCTARAAAGCESRH